MPIMQKIVTITGNLLAETTSRFVMPKNGETTRAVGMSTFQVGGKGVNVSRYAQSLGVDSVAIIFPAGFNGEKCLSYLERENFKTIPIKIDGETRQGLVCEDIESGVQTTFLGNDVSIPREAFYKCLDILREIISEGDVLVLCGSFPAWQSEYAKELSDLCENNKAAFCADTYGLPLQDIAESKTQLLKFNKKELVDFLKNKNANISENPEENFAMAREKYFSNTEIFAVTDGENDTIFHDKKNGRIEKIRPLKIEKEISATGCGDAFFAVALSEIFLKQSPTKTALYRAAKYASMCAETESTLPLSRDKVLIALSQ